MISSPLIKAVEVIPLLGEAVFLDARVGPDAVRAHETAHVSGAIHVDLETDLSEVGDPASGGRHPLPSLDLWLARLGAWGISPSTPVIVYDAAGGGMAAARAWWMLRAIGHESLAVVDGGWQALREAGVPMEGGHS
ncbi:MAG: sulfurtransferase, partial [Deltaproteobacteria bacterium]|nr:sulfurtransferase [Deltaproteobacteria bacterium]